MSPLSIYERLKRLQEQAEEEAAARLRKLPLSTPVTDPEDRLACRLADLLGDALSTLYPLACEAEAAAKENA